MMPCGMKVWIMVRKSSTQPGTLRTAVGTPQLYCTRREAEALTLCGAMPPNLEVWHLRRPLTRLALGTERAVGLMKDHFIDGLTLAAKFDNEALQFDNAKPAALLRGKAIGGLVVGL
jgi:hypothetical protein